MAATNSKAMGAFVLGGVLLFAVGLFLIGDRRMLFSGSGTYYAEFAGMSGLEVGDKVRVAGLDAGEVTNLRIPAGPGAKFQVKFRVVEKLFPIIRTDSLATIQTDGLLGNKYLLINTGTTAQAPLESTLPSREPFELADLLARVGETVKSINENVGATVKTISDTVGVVQVEVTSAVKSVSRTATHVDDIVTASQDDIKAMTMAANRITGDASVIMGRLSAGQGTVGKLLKDDTVYNNMADASKRAEEILADVHQTSQHVKELVVQFQSGKIPENIEKTMANVQDSTARLKVMVSALQPGLSSGEGMTSDLRAMMTSSREAMSDLAENMEALKHGFFFKGFFKNRGYFDLATISLSDYQSKDFEKKARKERQWVECPDLFILKADGTEGISEAGRASIDQAMEEFQRFTEGVALIVEGYSGIGTQNERFMKSRTRSALVREYLQKTFALGPDYVGVMAMGSVQSHSTPLMLEDGVALVLLRK